VRGVIHGGDPHRLHVAVTVAPVEAGGPGGPGDGADAAATIAG